MNKITPGLIGACVLASSMLVACDTSEKGSDVPKKELTFAMTKDIGDLNPHLYSGYMAVQGIVFESLVENTKDGIKPLLAKSWDVSKDGKEYTFKLRDDVFYHDGEKFDAASAKMNIDAVQANKETHSWIKLSQKIVKTEALDDYTIKITLSEPYYPTLAELSTTRPYAFTSPKDFSEDGTKNGVKGFHGTGPYVVKSYKKDQQASFNKNEKYWNGVPHINKITTKVLPSGETTYLALQKKEIDFLFTDDRGANSIDQESMNALEESGDYKVTQSNAMDTKLIIANSSKKNRPVSETAVREALWYAIDRKTISEDIMNGTEKPANALLSKNIKYADVSLKERSFNLEKAADFLDQAGWKSSKDSTVREKNGKKLEMDFYYDSNAPVQKTQAEFIQDAAKSIGMTLNIISEDSTAIADRRKSGNYDLLYSRTWGLAYDPVSTISAFTDVSYNLHSTKGISEAKTLYKKIDDVMVSTNETERQKLYDDILTIVHDEAVFIPITYGGMTVVAPKQLKNIQFKQTQYELPFEKFSY